MTDRLAQREIKEQKKICAAVCALLGIIPINTFLNDLTNKYIGKGFIYDSVLCYSVLLIIIVSAMFVAGKAIKKDAIFFGLFLATEWIIAYVFFPYNKFFMFTSWSDLMNNPIYILFVYSFFGYFYARYITNYEIFEKYLVRLSMVVIITSLISFFMTLEDNYQKQYMVFSYNMTLQIMFLLIMFFEKNKVSYLIVGLMGFIAIFLVGCRGAVACCLGSIMIYFLFKKRNMREKVIINILIGMCIFLVIQYFNVIIMKFAQLAEMIGIDSRTIILIQQGDFFGDSGRGEIIRKIIENTSVIGNGMYGDRLIANGSYAHNFVIEIIAQYGYLLGTAILIFVFYLLSRGVFDKDNRVRILVMVFMSTGFIKLFFSGSYLNQEPAFYVLLGLCVNSVNKGEKE